jgi:hypothetical protein
MEWSIEERFDNYLGKVSVQVTDSVRKSSTAIGK